MFDKKFLIVTPSYNENIGGVIALHLLCHRINALGIKAYLWDINRPHQISNSPWQILRFWWKNRKFQKKRYQNGFELNPDWNTPELQSLKKIDRDHWVIVYPEIIQANPLNASYLVRWFLYLPRYETYSNIGSKIHINILYAESSKKNFNNIDLEDDLLCTTLLHPAYFLKRGEINKNGIAYQIRKHDSKEKVNIPKTAIQIDNLNHHQIAEIFHKVEFFYSYDLYSFYSIYASLCGCKSIVIPKKGLPESEWRPKIEDRLGIAYGNERIDWALDTRQRLREYLDQKQEEEILQLKRFIKLCGARFS